MVAVSRAEELSRARQTFVGRVWNREDSAAAATATASGSLIAGARNAENERRTKKDSTRARARLMLQRRVANTRIITNRDEVTSPVVVVDVPGRSRAKFIGLFACAAEAVAAADALVRSIMCECVCVCVYTYVPIYTRICKTHA